MRPETIQLQSVQRPSAHVHSISMDSRQAGPQRWTHARPGGSVRSAWPPGQHHERRWSARCALSAGVRRADAAMCAAAVRNRWSSIASRVVPGISVRQAQLTTVVATAAQVSAPACVGAAMGRHDSPFTVACAAPVPDRRPWASPQRRRPFPPPAARRRRGLLLRRPQAGVPSEKQGGGAGSRPFPPRRLLYSTSRRSAAQRDSSWRLESCSLRSTADTCASTVLAEIPSRSAISLYM